MDIIHTIIEYTAHAISVASLAVIVYGTILAFIAFIRNEGGQNKEEGIRKIRVNFGSYLLLGLELLIAADVLETVVKPGYQELIVLGGIVLLRTLLSVFLNKEIKELE